MELRNLKILITGASDGIGKEMAVKLAREKSSLILLGRNEKRLEMVKKECEDAGSLSVDMCAFDLRDEKSFVEKINQILKNHKDISVLINNAGIWHKTGDLDTLELEEINAVLETNLVSLIKLTRLILPVLRNQNEAAILNIVSKSGVIPQEGQSVYSASKYGVKGFTDVLRMDLRKSKIKVTGIYQGGINTDMFKKAGDVNVPNETFTDPKDLADIIVFCLSRPQNIWMEEIHVGR